MPMAKRGHFTGLIKERAMGRTGKGRKRKGWKKEAGENRRKAEREGRHGRKKRHGRISRKEAGKESDG